MSQETTDPNRGTASCRSVPSTNGMTLANDTNVMAWRYDWQDTNMMSFRTVLRSLDVQHPFSLTKQILHSRRQSRLPRPQLYVFLVYPTLPDQSQKRHMWFTRYGSFTSLPRICGKNALKGNLDTVTVVPNGQDRCVPFAPKSTIWRYHERSRSVSYLTQVSSRFALTIFWDEIFFNSNPFAMAKGFFLVPWVQTCLVSFNCDMDDSLPINETQEGKVWTADQWMLCNINWHRWINVLLLLKSQVFFCQDIFK